MRIIEGLNRRDVCGVSVLVPMGENTADFSKIVSLNDTSLFLWKEMEKGDFTAESLVSSLTEEYDVDVTTARADVETPISKLRKEGMIAD